MAQFIVRLWKLVNSTLHGIALCAFASHADADTLRDPTIPADMVAAMACKQASSGPELQSVMRGTNMNAALISGEFVQLGQAYHGATLIKIRETTVVLRESTGNVRTLRMQIPLTAKPASSLNTVAQHCE